jgi:Fe-S-cluster containining protein
MVAPEEIEGQGGDAIAAAREEDGYLKTVGQKDHYFCKFFHGADHTCEVYQARPFECRLYPFLLTKEKNFPTVSVHLSCPYIQEHSGSEAFKRHVKALKEYFRQSDVLRFVLRNPSLPKSYPQHAQEIKHLFTLVH